MRDASSTTTCQSATTSCLARSLSVATRHDELVLYPCGFGATDFGGDSKFTGNFGAGFSVLPSDWLAVHVAVEDRVFNSDLLGVNKLANNLEAHLG